MLSVNGVTVRFGKRILFEDVNIKFGKGNCYGIIGANGAGKTTLISIITGILQQTSGQVKLDGSDIKDMGTKYLDKIGYLPQYPQFYPNFRVKEFLMYMCSIKDIPQKKAKEILPEIMEEVNLCDHMNKKIKELSGGMRQRLGIAQAILNDPKILILDEPTAGLDPQGAQEMMTLFMNLNKKEGKTVLLVTHDMEHVMNYCDHVIVLSHGEVTQEANVKEFFKHPEYLQEIGINPPSIVRLKMQLEENGFDMDPDIMDMNSLVDSIEKQVKKHE